MKVLYIILGLAGFLGAGYFLLNRKPDDKEEPFNAKFAYQGDVGVTKVSPGTAEKKQQDNNTISQLRASGATIARRGNNIQISGVNNSDAENMKLAQKALAEEFARKTSKLRK